MGGGLTALVRQLLSAQGRSENDLRDFLDSTGNTSFPIVYLDSIADPKIISSIAGYLNIPKSDLFELTHLKDHFVRAVFKELWPRYETRIRITEEDAWNKVWHGYEFRGDTGKSVRHNVDLFLEGLCPPLRDTGFPCEPLECTECPLLCKKTNQQKSLYL